MEETPYFFAVVFFWSPFWLRLFFLCSGHTEAGGLSFPIFKSGTDSGTKSLANSNKITFSLIPHDGKYL